MKITFFTLGVLWTLSTTGVAQGIDSIRKDLDDARARLAGQRESVAVEQVATGKAFEAVRAELMEKRRKVRIARMAKSDRDAMLKELEKKQYGYAQDHDFTAGQLRDYGLKFETFLLPGERAMHDTVLGGLREQGTTPADVLDRRLMVLEAGIARLEQVMGGYVVDGEAVAPDGELKQGRFVLAGPLAWYVANDDSLAGSVVRQKGASSPRVLPGYRGEIKTVVAGGEAKLGVDVSGGKALALAALEQDKLDIFRKGGFWIWPILGIALFSTLCGLVKLVQIIRIITPRSEWVAEILASLRQGDQAKAENLASRASHPVSNVIGRCLGYVKAGPDVVEEVLYEQLIGVQNKLQSWLPFIAITAATAPLLGLLGTVSGMIRTFNVITVAGTGDAKPLAGGISEALVTTLFGLIVAIPALIIHAMLARRCQGIIQNTEKLGLTFVNGLRSSGQSPDS